MTKRTVFNVQPTKGGNGWDLTQGSNVVSHHKVKETAVEKGRDIGNSTPHSQLRIKGENGKIQTEHTYGQDPRKYKG